MAGVVISLKQLTREKTGVETKDFHPSPPPSSRPPVPFLGHLHYVVDINK